MSYMYLNGLQMYSTRILVALFLGLFSRIDRRPLQLHVYVLCIQCHVSESNCIGQWTGCYWKHLSISWSCSGEISKSSVELSNQIIAAVSIPVIASDLQGGVEKGKRGKGESEGESERERLRGRRERERERRGEGKKHRDRMIKVHVSRCD